jgi:hypothetical protein
MGCGCGSSNKTTGSAPAGYGYKSVRWTGNGPIKVHGGLTGMTYRFDGYGSVVAIDDRDVTRVTGIPKMDVVV